MTKSKIFLTDTDIQELIECKKFYEGDCVYYFPQSGNRINIELFAYAPVRTAFLLDVIRQSFNFKKVTYQQRVYTTVTLLRE